MSAPRPLPWKIQQIQIMHPWREGGIAASTQTLATDSPVTAYAERAVNAFDALLAVAKATAQDGCCDSSGVCEGAGFHNATFDTLKALDAAHPGWREWTP